MLRDLLPALLLLAAGTLFFRLTDADIRWCNPWREGESWPHGDDFPWSLLYHVGTYPALLAVLAALAVLLMGFRRPAFARFRRQSVYLVLVMAFGPGVIANTLLKDHWGRPRPREVQALGGLHPYEPILTMDPLSPGKSFPCGHATMGFFFFAAYFLLRTRHPAAARWSLVGALGFGVAIGWARVVQGGHFPSDVLWAAGVLWFVCAILAHWLKVNKLTEIQPDFRPLSWPKLSAACLLVPALVFLVLLATPIDRKDRFVPENPLSVPADLRLQIPLGETILEQGDDWEIAASSHGFGLPGGGIKSVWKEETGSSGIHRFEVKQRVSGLTTELNQTIRAKLPAQKINRVHLTQESGIVRLHLPDAPRPGESRRWTIELQEGDLEIIHGASPVYLKDGESRVGPEDAPDEVELHLGPTVRKKITPR